MTDEERQRQMDFIVNQQAQFTADMQKLKERQVEFDANMQKLEEDDVRANKRIDRLERIMRLVISAGLRERKERRESSKEMRESIQALIASQAHTDQRLDILIDIVSEGRNGKSK